MREEFINPNWHVIWVHYPLALLTVGIIIELLGFLWKRSSVRTAARWMILLGALATLPTVTTGIYAFLDAAKGASDRPNADWQEVVKYSHWGPAQWTFMVRHIWLTSITSALFVIAVVLYMASSDRAREKLRWPVLAVLVVALGAMSAGAWHSGEAVYRYGVAVTPQSTENLGPSEVGHEQAGLEHSATPGGLAERIERYVPPVQVHLLMVGFTLALTAVSIGVMLRRWNREAPFPADVGRPLAPDELAAEPVHLPGSASGELLRPEERVETAVFPARYWLLAGVLAILTAAGGLWLVAGSTWDLSELQGLWDSTKAVFSPEKRKDLTAGQVRMVIHGGLGVTIILLLLVLAALTRWARRWRVLPLILAGLLLVAVGFQIWVGVMLLYAL